MNLMLDVRGDGDTAFVTCRGHIVHGATARRFRACIGRLLRRYRRVVLDLRAVTHIDARGVAMVAALIAQATAADRRVVLAWSSDRVERVLRLTGLDVLLHHDSRVPGGSDLLAEADEDRRPLQQAVAHRSLRPCDGRSDEQGASK